MKVRRAIAVPYARLGTGKPGRRKKKINLDADDQLCHQSLMAHQGTTEAGTDPRLLLLDARDNVFVVRARVRAGETISVSGVAVTVPAEVPLGHKIARRDITVGDKVRKYGAPIGSVTNTIHTGEHVHVHNIKSDYTPTYSLAGEDRRYEERA